MLLCAQTKKGRSFVFLDLPSLHQNTVSIFAFYASSRLTLTAWGPFGELSTSKDTRSNSLSVLKPLLSMFEK